MSEELKPRACLWRWAHSDNPQHGWVASQTIPEPRPAGDGCVALEVIPLFEWPAVPAPKADGQWTQGVTPDGRAYIQDEDFTYDARLYVDGDFPSEQARAHYVDRILAALKDRDVVLEEAAKVASYGRSELQPFVEGAAVAWCGQKDRETFTSDLDYFKENWWALQGMQDFVRAFAIRNLKERV